MNNVQRNRLHTTLIASVLGLSLSGAAMAEESTAVSAERLSSTHAVAVDYTDLNLRHSSGRETLENRLERAAEQVCGSSELRLAGNVRDALRNKACQEQAVERALDRVYSARHEIAMLSR